MTEVPEADGLEQELPANPIDEEPQVAHPADDVPEWDAVEQTVVVDLDDDYRD